jgi:Fur family ferric uptake transcriptional regulator
VSKAKAQRVSQELERAKGRLEAAKLRVTRPRVGVLRVLIEEHGPFSVEEIRDRADTSDLDRVTVYRCLTAFEELGLVRRCEFGDSISRYEYASAEHHHHHVICRKCRRTESLEDCIPDALTEAVRKLGYEDVSHSLEFFGVCGNCRKK